ncbi:MAG: hypothetical protein R2695_19750 [Acidimicrobiales bacterium]
MAGRPLIGLFLTAGLAVVMANVVSLTAISSTASAAFLIIFAATNLAAARLADTIDANRAVCRVAAAACIIALSRCSRRPRRTRSSASTCSSR